LGNDFCHSCCTFLLWDHQAIALPLTPPLLVNVSFPHSFPQCRHSHLCDLRDDSGVGGVFNARGFSPLQ